MPQHWELMLLVITNALNEGAMMTLRIFEKMAGRNERIAFGPAYGLKIGDFFDRAINKGVEFGGVPIPKIIEMQANEFLGIVDADPDYRDGNDRLVEKRLNPMFLKMQFTSIGPAIINKILPPLLLNINFSHETDAVEANSIALSKFQEIYCSQFYTPAKIEDKMTTSITKLRRERSLLRDGFSDENGSFVSFQNITNEHNGQKMYFQTKSAAELACYRKMIEHDAIVSYTNVWGKVWSKYLYTLTHRKEIFVLNNYFLSDIEKLKGNSEAKVLEVIQKNIKNYRDFLECVANFDLSTALQHRMYLEEGISINNFFSQEAEKKLSLEVIQKYLSKVLT
jgi:hypothetical protein